MKIQLNIQQVLEWIVLGIDNGNYQAAKQLALEAIKELKERKEREDQEEAP